MFSTKFIRVFKSFIVLAFTLVQHTYSHPVGEHDEGFVSIPKTEPFLAVTEEHRDSWNRVIEHCFPLNTRGSLRDRCMTSLGEYFANEPVWSYSNMYVYGGDGWRPLIHLDLSQRRNHSPADFLNTDVPFWRDIFDGQLEQRQKFFLRVVNDSKCKEIARADNYGMQDYWADHCAVREMYKYATYLSACTDAKHRLSAVHTVIPEDVPVIGGLTEFEKSFLLLDEYVSDEALKSAAKRNMEKSYLHASWVAAQCSLQGFVLMPGISLGSYTSNEEPLPWGTDYQKYYPFLSYTHDFIMKIAIKSGDDWAIRSGYLGRSYIAEFSDDLMKRYPLLMHRVIGGNPYGFGYGIDLTSEERARHRAKAYLLLVEEAGEEFARLEYDPIELTEEIQYVESGGLLRSPPSRPEIEEKKRERLRQRQEEELLEEVQGELFN